MNIKVHDTAFIIAYYRSRHEELSRDRFAHLWMRPTLSAFANDFAKHVSEHDEILHCMRNRHFHDSLQEKAQEHDKLLFINLGAGFSMYPYSLPKKVVSIEVDFSEIMLYKDIATKKFIKEGKLPERNTLRISADITSETDQTKLAKFIKAYSDYKKVILIEGVLFFLTPDQIQSVFSFCRKVLSIGDYVQTVSFDNNIDSYDVFKRLKTYFSKVIESENNPYTVLPHDYYNRIDGFKLLDRTSTFELGHSLGCYPGDLKNYDVLEEFCYTLERT